MKPAPCSLTLKGPAYYTGHSHAGQRVGGRVVVVGESDAAAPDQGVQAGILPHPFLLHPVEREPALLQSYKEGP